MADVDALAEQIGDAGRSRSPAAREHGDRLGVERHDAAQVVIGPASAKALGALVGVALPVGLHQREVELAVAQRHEVVERARRRLGAAAQPPRSARFTDSQIALAAA